MVQAGTDTVPVEIVADYASADVTLGLGNVLVALEAIPEADQERGWRGCRGERPRAGCDANRGICRESQPEIRLAA